MTHRSGSGRAEDDAGARGSEPRGAADREAADAFWQKPEIVARFAGNPPDHRLVRILDAREEGAEGDAAEGGSSAPLRVLDLGCAGGRNAALLAERGADVYAVDRSPAMVEHTRARLAPILGAEEAARRVRRTDMDDLSAFEDGAFDLVVALGILQAAATPGEWARTLDGVVRVTRAGGHVLVANFDPRSEPEGEPLVRGEHPDVWFWREEMPMTLLEADALDAAFAARGALPAEPTDTVRVEAEGGFRRTVNALYRVG